MPEYAFSCRKCRKRFTLTLSITDYGKRKVKCPNCSSTRVERQISAFSVQTSKKS